jgi:Ca-activated chloride channel family protein
VRVSGYLGEEYWEESIEFRDREPRTGISELWASQRIAGWMDAHRLAQSERERGARRAQIVRVGLDHHLVTAFTSLVAVERLVVRRDSDPLTGHLVPSLLPKGWQHGKAFNLARTATPAPALLLVGGVLVLLASTLLCMNVRRKAM